MVRRMRRASRAIVLFVATLIAANASAAQEVESSDPFVRAYAREVDGASYVYHTALLPLGYGFNLYRQEGSEVERLTDEPVYAAQTGDEFLRMTDPDEYARLAAAFSLTRPERMGPDSTLSPQDVFFALRSVPATTDAATFLYPSVARALGRLYVDEEARAGDSVTYRFEFVNALGTPTGDSLQASVEIVPQAPGMPLNVQASNVDSVITLQWNYPLVPDGAADDGVVRFEVYRFLDNDGADLVDAVRLTDEPIARILNYDTFHHRYELDVSGMRHRFAVVAYDMTGQASMPASVDFVWQDNTPPEQLVDVAATSVANSFIQVTWTPSAEFDVEGYNVYRSLRGDSLAVWTRQNEALLPTSDAAFLDTTVANPTGGRTYFYRVMPVDSAGNEAPPSALTFAQIEDRVPPPAPTAIEAEVSPRDTTFSVHVRWTVEDVAPDLITYSVTRRRMGRGAPPVGIQVNTENVTGFELIDLGPDQGFLEGERYEYAVSALDSSRNYSDAVRTTVDIPNATPPEPPPSFAASNERGRSAVLTWRPSPASDVTAYRIFRGRDQGSVDLLVEVPSTVFSYEDLDVAPDQTYVYTIRAVDTGANEGPASIPSAVTLLDGQGPRRVWNVRARTAAEGGVVVLWEPVPDADVAGYRVLRAPIANGVFLPVLDDLLPPDVTVFADTDGEVGTFYRVIAVDRAGNESHPGKPAQAVSR